MWYNLKMLKTANSLLFYWLFAYLFVFHTRFAMEKISVSAFLLLVALSYTLAKDTTVKPGAKKDAKDSGPKLPQTLSRGRSQMLLGFQCYLAGNNLILQMRVVCWTYIIISTFSRGFASSLVWSIYLPQFYHYFSTDLGLKLSSLYKSWFILL